VKDGETGFVVPPRDSNALARRIELLLEDERLRRTLGLNGRQLVEESYSLDAMLSKLEAVYQDVIKR